MEDKFSNGWGDKIRAEIKKNLDYHLDSKFAMAFFEAMQKENYLLEYCQSVKAFTVVLQLIESLLKHSKQITDGY